MLQRFGTILTLVIFLLTLLLGGNQTGGYTWQKLLMVFSWLTVALLWLPEYRFGFATRRGLFAALIATFGIFLGLAQIIPLPASIWELFPGRDFVKNALELSGQAGRAMPISLDPAATLTSLATLTCGLAFFLAGQKMPAQNQIHFAFLIIAFGIFSVILGLAQKFSGDQLGLYPYQTVGGNVAQGTFRNRNNFATLLYCSIPFLFVVAVTALVKRKAHIVVVATFCLLYLAMMIAGIAASASRSGMILAMVAVVLSAALSRGLASTMEERGRASFSKVGFAGLLTLLLVFSQFGLVSIMRLAETDPVSDARSRIFAKGMETAMNFFPVGSGFGTFVPVYKLTERPEDMLEGVFINHAHNDYIELLIEGGLLAAILVACALVWYAVATRSVWKNVGMQSHDLIAKASSITVLLLLLHSLVEFPLRIPALMALFGLCCGYMSAASPRLRQSVNAPKQTPSATSQSRTRTAPRFKPGTKL